MSTIADKLAYLLETKRLIKKAVLNKGVNISDGASFRDYANKISDIPVGGISYVIGEPVNVDVPANAWNGSTASVKATGYHPSGDTLFIGLPANDSTVNTQRVVAAALTLPKYTTSSANTSSNIAAYTMLTLSAVNAPTEDMVIAVFGLEEVTTLVKVTDAVVAGVTVPVTGEKPVTTIDCDQVAGTITWSPTATTFAASTKYTATITLTAKPGYTLTGVTSNFFTVEGASSVSNSADSGVVTVVFPATAAEATT